jgi:hypothetical protein
MLTVTQCRKILGNMANDWSDETVLEVRDWLSTLAELILQVDQKTQENEKESNCIHPRVNRRTKQRI